MSDEQAPATKKDLAELNQLVTDLSASLERQLLSGFEEMASRFDTQSARLDRQAGLIQTGSRWTNRMNDWAETVDSALARKDQELAELRSRVEKLERMRG